MTTKDPVSRWLSQAEAAEYLSVSHSWVKAARADGTLPWHRFGKVVRFDRDDLDAYIAKQRRDKKPVQR